MRQCILVELDCLLDTRLGTLIKLDESVATEVIKSDYHLRESDRWNELVDIEVDQAGYDYLYRSRDVDTLKLSKITSLLPVLSKMLADVCESSLSDIESEGVQLHINYHPYKLSDTDIEALKQALRYHLTLPVELSFVSIPMVGLMPSVVKDTYDGVIMYDIDGWLKKHQNALIECAMPTVIFMGPAIYFNEKPTAEQVREEIGDEYTPFQAIEIVLAEYIALRLIDVSNFSLIRLGSVGENT